MTLAEMAKQMQQETVSLEIQELRRMRKFLATHGYDEMNGRWAEVARLEANGGRDTIEGQYFILKKIKELNRDADLLKLYRCTLIFAERKEREKSGGGADFYRENRERIRKAEIAICQEAKDWENMQISIDELKRIDEERKGGNVFGKTSNGEFIEDVRGNGADYLRAEIGNETFECIAQ